MTLEQRVETLEQRNRQLRRTGILVLSALAAGLLISVGFIVVNRAVAKGGNGPKVVEAAGFRLMDKQGRLRACLTMRGHSPKLDLYDEQGNRRAGLFLDEDGRSGLQFVDEQHKGGVILGMLTTGTRLDSSDEQGKIRKVLVNVPGLAFYDENGKTRAAMGVMKGGPALDFYDTEDKKTWSAP